MYKKKTKQVLKVEKHFENVAVVGMAQLLRNILSRQESCRINTKIRFARLVDFDDSIPCRPVQIIIKIQQTACNIRTASIQ